MRKRIDLLGKKLGKLIVVEYVGIATNGDALWKCRCKCGELTIARGSNLASGHTRSCGCLQKETLTTHNCSYKPEYLTWDSMIQRCTNPKSINYMNYGGRGIIVCDRWKKFANFFADMGERPNKNKSIERIDNNKGYYPLNCKWGTRIEQSRNTRIQINNKTGVKGVWWSEKRGKYEVSINVNRKKIYLGSFVLLEDAKTTRKQGEIKYWGAEIDEDRKIEITGIPRDKGWLR